MRKRKERLSKKLLLVFVLFFLLLILIVIFKLFLDLRIKKTILVSPLPVSKKENTSLENLKTALSKKNISFSQVSSSQSAFIVRLITGEEVVFASNKSLEKQISSLQLILSRLTIEGKRFQRLDFRFDKPVVSFK